MKETKLGLVEERNKSSETDYKTIKKIIVKGTGYRTIGAIVDFALTAFAGMILWLFFSSCIFVPIAKASKYINVKKFDADSQALIEECGASHLFKENPEWTGKDDTKHNKYITFYVDDDKPETGEFKHYTWENYRDDIYDYYSSETSYLKDETKFKPDTVAKNKDKYTNYWFNVYILGLSDEQGIYFELNTNDSRDDYVKNNKLWEYQKDDEGTHYDWLAVPSKSLCDESGNVTDEGKIKLRNYFYDKDAKMIEKEIEVDGNKFSVAYKACIYEYSINCHWIYESGDSRVLNLIETHQANIKKTNNMQVTYPVLTSIIISWIIFYLIIPVSVKNGRTLGKMMFKMAIVNKLGYNVTVPQMLLRSLFPLLIIIIFYLVGISSMMFIFYLLLMFVTLISYCLTIFTKHHQALHDFVAGTLVIDSEASAWFKNAVEEENYQKELATVETREEREARLTKEYQEKYGNKDEAKGDEVDNELDEEKEARLTREYHEKYGKNNDENSEKPCKTPEDGESEPK